MERMSRSVIQEIKEHHKQNGLGHVLRNSVPYAYNLLLRPYLPKRTVSYNGVLVGANRVTDGLNPSQDDGNRPNYESGICHQLRTVVEPGDTVLVVGGGWGVTTTVAAQQVGEDGRVHVYEGAVEYVPRIEETVQRNDVAARVTVHEAIVGTPTEVWGNETKNRIDPGELPECDVLEMDCEGAEIEILKALDATPPKIIVETHGNLGAPTDDVASVLESSGYSIVDERIGALDREEMHRSQDVKVLTALRDR
jgi:hypothetical protein